MAVEVGLEDDLYFADLNRQISLLIDEDDDDYSVSQCSAIPQVYARSVMQNNTQMLGTQYVYQYQESCRREMCKGTGVFIPQSTQPRRKHKQGKRSSSSYYAAAKSNNNNNVNKQLVRPKARTNNYNNNDNNNNNNAPPPPTTNATYAAEYFNRY